MQKERVTENVYIFTSHLYVQVTAGVIMTSQGAVLFDTLLYPEETLQIKRFVEDRLGQSIRYVINSHHHADHTLGTCFFPQATVIAHKHCRDLLDTIGRESLEQFKKDSPDMEDVELVLPQVVFEDEMRLHLGDTTLVLKEARGHSEDLITCLIEQEQILFASDAVMPIPYFPDGDYHETLRTLQSLRHQHYENIIQGHGEIILRGEIDARLQNDIQYLERVYHAVNQAFQMPEAQIESALSNIDIESCGKSPIALQGIAPKLHKINVRALAYARREPSSSNDSAS